MGLTSKFTQALRNIWNQLFNPPLSKQDFIDLGFTVDDEFTTDNWWSFKEKLNFINYDGKTHIISKVIIYDLENRWLYVNYIGNPFGKHKIVNQLKIESKKELDLLMHYIKDAFLENQ